MIAAMVVGVLLIVGVWFGLYPRWQRSRLNEAAAHYGPGSSAATARWLAQALDNRQVDRALGDRILKALITPRVVKRHGYAVGRGVYVMLLWPHSARLEHLRERFSERFYANDKAGRGWGIGESGGRGRQYLVHWGGVEQTGPIGQAVSSSGSVVAITKPGKYHMTVVQRYTLIDANSYKTVYAATVRVPVTFRMVSPAKADRVKLISNAKLDRAMHAAFSSRIITTGRSEVSFKDGHGFTLVGDVKISYQNLPADVWFIGKYVDSSGKVFPFSNNAPGSRYLIARRGETGSRKIDPEVLFSKKHPAPGSHHGYLVLTPDPKAAYRDARFKQIWGGTLRFPWRFTVKRTP